MQECESDSNIDVLSLPSTPIEEFQGILKIKPIFDCLPFFFGKHFFKSSFFLLFIGFLDNEEYFQNAGKKVLEQIAQELIGSQIAPKINDLFINEDFLQIQNQHLNLNIQQPQQLQQIQSQSFHPLTFVMIPPFGFIPQQHQSQQFSNSTLTSNQSHTTTTAFAPAISQPKESFIMQSPLTSASESIQKFQTVNFPNTISTQICYNSDASSEATNSPLLWDNQIQSPEPSTPSLISSSPISTTLPLEKSIKIQGLDKRSQPRNRDKNNKQVALDEELRSRNIPRGVKGFCEIHNKLYPMEKLDPSNVRKYLTGSRPATQAWIHCQKRLLNGVYDQPA